MKTILFQGDSITDVGRTKDDRDEYLGSGYATMVSGMIGRDYPGHYRMRNRAMSGDRTVDVYARIKKDVINLEPDVLTVLIGVNDTWHELAWQNGFSIERYETLLELMICDVKAARPEIEIVFLEPFCLHGFVTDQFYDDFSSDVFKRQAVCKKLAEKHGLIFVPLQKMLEDFAEKYPEETLLLDGVHPSYTGHTLIAEAVYTAMKPILK